MGVLISTVTDLRMKCELIHNSREKLNPRSKVHFFLEVYNTFVLFD